MSRIIAGSRGGRRITTRPGPQTRPTTDRVREALFAAIASWAGTAASPAEAALNGLAFADLFAGSGAVGLEAASRGSAPVWLVEADRRCVEGINTSVAELELEVIVRQARVEQLVRQPPPTTFDVIFLDPPYDLDHGMIGSLLADLERGWLTPDGLIVVERSSRTPELSWPDAFSDLWSRRYGETVLYFGQR